MVELLKQPQYEPMHVADEILSIHAGVRGFLDDLPLDQVRPFEQELLKYYRDEYPELRERVLKDKWTDELDERLKEIVKQCKAAFLANLKKAEAAGASSHG
jgi:F-type H+-transporting ATPase subunit alpha